MEAEYSDWTKHEALNPSSQAEDIPQKVQVTVNYGQGYVWDPRDVWRLWRELRVVGRLVGTLPRHPHQSNTLGLPLRLLPEEVSLLLEEGLGETVRYKEMEEKPSQEMKEKFNTHRETCYKEQVEEAVRQRKEQIRNMAGKIWEGKKKKFLMKKSKEEPEENGEERKDEEPKAFTLTIEEVIKEEEEKLTPLPPHHQVIEVFTSHPLLRHLTSIPSPWPHPTTQHEKVKTRVYSDLWHQGHYLTSGIKFGGDFLVYAGNPNLHHAHAIVRCVVDLIEVDRCDLAAATRVAAATKKTFVIASVESGKVVYHSYHWLEDRQQEEEEEEEEEEQENDGEKESDGEKL